MSLNEELKVGGLIVTGKQIEIDRKMLFYDIWATRSHVLMLNKIGVITEKEISPILHALYRIEDDIRNNKFKIDQGIGSHFSIENMIINYCGDIGYKIHTARSRNDQIITTEMLYLRDQVLHIIRNAMDLQNLLLFLSKKHIVTIMPGYTHMQPAKPTTVGQWFLSYFDSLMRGINSLQRAFEKYNMNPLGAVESYGTSWNIDREFTCALLGFSKVWEIPIDVVSSRGFVQLEYLKAFSEVSLTISKLTQDLLLFNTIEFGMIELGDKVSQRMHPITGSSVMPQKKNPDILELIRSNTSQIIGIQNIVTNLLISLPMGYNRDTREIKEHIEFGIDKVNLMLDSLKMVLSTLIIKEPKMKQTVLLNFSLTTDLADYVAQKNNLGYRLVYKIIGSVVDEKIRNSKVFTEIKASEIIKTAKQFGIRLNLSDEDLKEAIDPSKCIARRVHLGGTNRKIMETMITKRENSLYRKEAWVTKNQQRIVTAKEKTEVLTLAKMGLSK